MGKSEVYSWRLSSRLKAELVEAARLEKKSLAQLLDAIAEDWLEHFGDRTAGSHERQQRLRDAALESVGALRGNAPSRTENVRSEIRSRLIRRHAR